MAAAPPPPAKPRAMQPLTLSQPTIQVLEDGFPPLRCARLRAEGQNEEKGEKVRGSHDARDAPRREQAPHGSQAGLPDFFYN